jgi:Cys-rich repeat protein
VVGCETDRKFVSATSAAGPTAPLPEAGVDPAPNVDSLPLCPAGASCEDTGCTDDSQCAAPTRCDREMRRCIGCRSNADCSNEGGLCRTSDGACVECLTNRECASDFGASRCGADGKCAPCSNDDDCSLVGNGLNTCLLLTGGNNRCVQCITNDECANGAVCNTDIGAYECVECSSNGDCTDPGASRCEANRCLPCLVDTDCDGINNTPGAPGGIALAVCDAGACVECTGLRFEA